MRSTPSGRLAIAVLASLSVLPLAAQGAHAGVLDELRARGLGKWVDTYVEEKNGDVRLKPAKKDAISNLSDGGSIKKASRTTLLPEGVKPAVVARKTQSSDSKTTAAYIPTRSGNGMAARQAAAASAVTSADATAVSGPQKN